MNMQEILNTSIRGIIAQGGPAYDQETEQCFYRLPTDNGTLKCAAGHLIPDEEYFPFMEGHSACAIDFFRKFPPPERKLIEHLQLCHDHAAGDPRRKNVSFWSLWRAQLARYETRCSFSTETFSLDLSVLDEIPLE